jgi:hypothetical protein
VVRGALLGGLAPPLRTRLPQSDTASRISFQDFLVRRLSAIRQRDGWPRWRGRGSRVGAMARESRAVCVVGSPAPRGGDSARPGPDQIVELLGHGIVSASGEADVQPAVGVGLADSVADGRVGTALQEQADHLEMTVRDRPVQAGPPETRRPQRIHNGTAAQTTQNLLPSGSRSTTSHAHRPRLLPAAWAARLAGEPPAKLAQSNLY